MRKKRLFSFLSVFLLVFGFFGLFTNVVAEDFVPEEYHTNYHIKTEREELLNLIIDIEAAQKVGAEFTTDQFAKLHDIFAKVFQYFPKSPANQLIYKQCELTTATLSQEITKNSYAIFKEKCFSPIGDLIKKIQSSFTVKAEASVKPKQGPAPLNVTFDARNSKDPSSDTIPSNNFFWYYKDVHGDDRMIGRGPIVNYTFEDPGNHIVHLTVRSANSETQGIFDGSKDIAVNVAPKSANMVVRVNNHVLSTDNVFRVGTYEAKKGILIDGTSITPIGARTILEYTWDITSTENNYKFKKSGTGTPGQFVHKFPKNGRYQISISLTDNENNKISEKYAVSISDPVTIIKIQPKEGNTSKEYTFDASASYSLTSRVKTYQWLLRDPTGHEEIIESKKLKRMLSIPGNYFVKLTVTDDLGHSSYDERSFYVKSTSPVPSFTIKPSSLLKNPSEFILDASATFDADVLLAQDSLSYNRSVSPSSGVEIIPLNEDMSKVTFLFNKIGKYTVKLRVNDNYGESEEVEKNIEVKSVLRPSISVSPDVAKWGEDINFSVAVNQEVIFYERDFGDGKQQKLNTPTTHHAYEKAGVYKAHVRVINRAGEENEVTKQIFVGQKDLPVIAYEVKMNQNTLQAHDICTSSTGETVPAYAIDRYEHFTLDANTSVNTLGEKKDITISLHPQNDEVFNKPMISYNFLEVGCHYIDVFVTDKNLGKSDTSRIWFNVHNALPTLDNLILKFAQAKTANNTHVFGVGSNPLQANAQDILGDNNADPIVELEAKGAKDPDGFISHYARYYYETKNPDNIIALKITPSNVPHTNFVIPRPRYASQYSFVVRMVDNDNTEITSEDILGKGPVVFFPPGENNLDVPIVTLIMNKGYAKVGEEVTFTTKSEILSKKPDFEATRYFKYDFDGDGEYDMTTKKSEVQYTYQKPGEKHPKVAVFYKGRAGVGMSEKVIVQKGLKPQILFDVFDNKVLAKNISLGDIEQATLCLDEKKCQNDEHRMLRDPTSFLFAYDVYDEHKWNFNVLDAYGNEQSISGTLHLKKDKNTGMMTLLSIPHARVDDMGAYAVDVGSTLDNTLLLYIDYTDGNCFVDSDITHDADGNGAPEDDNDISCNEMHDIAFTPTKPEQLMRVYYVGDGVIKTKDIHISFIDFEEHIDEQYQQTAHEIQGLIDVVPNTSDDMLLFYKNLLINLKSSLGETNNRNSILIQLRQLLDENPNIIDETQKQKTLDLILSLSDNNVTQVFEGTIYDTAKSNIVSLFDEEIKEQAGVLFRDFERSEGKSPDVRKKVLDEIYKLAVKTKDEGKLDISDLNYIQKNFCDIIVYYELPSKTCGTAVDIDPALIDKANKDAQKSSKKGAGSSILKIIIIVVVVLAVIFGGIVLFFAIKSRNHDDEDDDDDEDDLDEE